MDHPSNVDHFNQQIEILMKHTNSRDEALKAYFKHGENAVLAANAIYFDRFMTSHFCHHFHTIMDSLKKMVMCIYYWAQILRILPINQDHYEFACLVSEII